MQDKLSLLSRVREKSSNFEISENEEVYFKEILELKQDHEKTNDSLSQLKKNVDYTIQSLKKCYRNFEKSFVKEVESSKLKLKKKITRSFLNISKEKLPDIYLRSIPKFGGSELSNAMHTTLLKMKRLSEKSGNLVSVNFSKELVDEISDLMEDQVDGFFIDPREIIENIIRSIENSIYTIRDQIDQLETCLFNSQSQNESYIEKLITMKKLIKQKSIEEENLKMKFKEKDEKMDRLRNEILRFNKLLENQRKDYYHELINVKMKLYEKQTKDKDIPESDIPIGNFTLNYIQGNKSSSVMNKIPNKTEFVVSTNRKINVLQDNFLKQKAEIEGRAKETIEKKDSEINKLEKQIQLLKRKLAE